MTTMLMLTDINDEKHQCIVCNTFNSILYATGTVFAQHFNYPTDQALKPREKINLFPFNHSNISNEWVKAVRRENWKPSKHSKLYSDHFLSSDFKVSRAVREEN
ncbi:THAP domain [Popillia japonica]|uniref:THAP domain n=1 Tax=Popillia japonica TaxID=7064 RepID=A0AAW1I8S9_POPJA